MSRTEGHWKIWSLLSLVLGGLLYVFLRPLEWMPNFGVSPEVPLFLHQQLPDALWTFSFSALLLSLDRKISSTFAALAWPLFLSWLLEGLQALELWPGTADFLDAAAAAGGAALIIIMLKQQQYERPTS